MWIAKGTCKSIFRSSHRYLLWKNDRWCDDLINYVYQTHQLYVSDSFHQLCLNFPTLQNRIWYSIQDDDDDDVDNGDSLDDDGDYDVAV